MTGFRSHAIPKAVPFPNLYKEISKRAVDKERHSPANSENLYRLTERTQDSHTKRVIPTSQESTDQLENVPKSFFSISWFRLHCQKRTAVCIRFLAQSSAPEPTGRAKSRLARVSLPVQLQPEPNQLFPQPVKTLF